MKHFSLILSLLILFTLSFLCLSIVLWDNTLLLALCRMLPVFYAESWGKAFFFALGFIGLGCSLSLFALLLGLEPGSRDPVVLENEAGTVGVSLDAIEEFIKRKGTSVHGVRDLHVRAEVEDGGLVLSTKVVLELQRNVPEFSREFQEKLRRELTETLGLGKIKEIRVMIHKIFPRNAAKEPPLLSPPTQVLLKEPDVAPPEKIETSREGTENPTEEVIIIPEIVPADASVEPERKDSAL